MPLTIAFVSATFENMIFRWQLVLPCFYIFFNSVLKNLVLFALPHGYVFFSVSLFSIPLFKQALKSKLYPQQDTQDNDKFVEKMTCRWRRVLPPIFIALHSLTPLFSSQNILQNVIVAIL
jgi:hypothetical protein